MMLGPFWCVEENAWLRFNVNEKGEAEAQMAARNIQYPTLTNPWQEASPAQWHIFDTKFEAGSPDAHSYFALKDCTIYRCDGISKLTGKPMISKFTIGQDDQANWTVATRTQLFETVPTLSKTCPILPLPMTPEELLLAWDGINQNLYLKDIASTVESEFNPEQREELIDSLDVHLGLQRSTTALIYLDTLWNILNNETSSIRLAIKFQAAKTIDYDSLIGSTITQLAKKKETFLFNVITALYNHICTLLHINEPPPSKEAIATEKPFGTEEVSALKTSNPLHSRAKVIRFNYIHQQINSLFSLEQKKELLASLERILDSSDLQYQVTETTYQDVSQNIVESSEHPVHQRIVALSQNENTMADYVLNPLQETELHETICHQKLQLFLDVLKANQQLMHEPASAKESSIALTPSTVRNPDEAVKIESSTKLNQKIITALEQAQQKYAKWYNHEQQYRGANGFFSWARHGSYGQARALTLTKQIKDCTEAQAMMDSINKFLTDSKTRYHRHSFSSFLLDELTQIESTPWNQLKTSASNHYDMRGVTNKCAAQF
jgi:hypothetical protein